MSVQNPPTQIVPIYNSTNFLIATEGLSISTGDNRYYKLSGGILSGLMTANAGINSVGPISISDTTQSTSRTTGSLVVSGGLGVSLDTHMNNLHLNASSSELKISGVNGYLNINNNTNASTSSSSGALQCAGGAYFGGNSLMNANLTLQGASSTLALSGASSVLTLSNTSASTSSTTGALRCGGGAGFGGSCFLSGLTAGGSNNFDFSGSSGNFLYRNRNSCKIVRNTTLNVNNNTWTQLTGCGISNGGFDTSISSNMNATDSITIRRSGIYKIVAYGKTGYAFTTSIKILLNGTNTSTNRFIQGLSLGAGTDDSFICLENVCSLSNNDVLRVYYYQDSGVAKTFGSATDIADYLSLAVIYLGET